MDKLKIYIYSHRDFKCPATDKHIYAILNQDNTVVTDTELDLFHDNIGETLPSDLNRAYGEAKGIYWIWKNKKYLETEYIGLCHYRRYFDFSTISSLNKHRIILHKPTPISLYASLALEHSKQNADIIRSIIKDLYPDKASELLHIFDNYYIYNCNTFIMHQSYFDEYCKFIFSIIDKYREILNINTWQDVEAYVGLRLLQGEYYSAWTTLVEFKYDVRKVFDYQCRLFGFIFERISSLWWVYKFGINNIIENDMIFDNTL